MLRHSMPWPRSASPSGLSGPPVSERASPKTNKAHGGKTPVSPTGCDARLNCVNSVSEPSAKG
jgi:hypothetical protein